MADSGIARRSWLFLVGLNAPAFSLAMIHIVNNPNLYNYALTRFIDLGLLERNRLNSGMGALGILGLLIAGMVQPSVGILSDRTYNQIGSRHPFFIGGGVAIVLALYMITAVVTWPLLILAVILLQIALNSVQSPVQALIPDCVHPEQMGLASGIKTVLELLGIVTSGLIVWLFLGNNTRPPAAVAVSTAILFTTIFITIRVAPRQEVIEKVETLTSAQRYLRRYASLTGSEFRARLGLFRNGFLRLIRQRPLMWWMASRFLFYASFNTIGKFSVNYMMDVYGYTDDEARAISGKVVVATGIVIFFTTIIAGILADRMERRYIAASGSLIAALASVVLIGSPHLNLAAIMIGIIGVGSGIFLSVGWALMTNLVPLRQAAFYLGLANIATILGGAFGMLGGFLVDLLNNRADDSIVGYQVLFSITTITFLLGALAINQVREQEKGHFPG